MIPLAGVPRFANVTEPSVGWSRAPMMREPPAARRALTAVPMVPNRQPMQTLFPAVPDSDRALRPLFALRLSKLAPMMLLPDAPPLKEMWSWVLLADWLGELHSPPTILLFDAVIAPESMKR